MCLLLQWSTISIHTFLTEGDQWPMARKSFTSQFQSTPSLRKVTLDLSATDQAKVFQSTPSLRKVTIASKHFHRPLLFQSTPSLRKVTFLLVALRSNVLFQSTPSLRKVTLTNKADALASEFQSTPSLRKVTAYQYLPFLEKYISIHTFLTEGDLTVQKSLPK